MIKKISVSGSVQLIALSSIYLYEGGNKIAPCRIQYLDKAQMYLFPRHK